WQLNVPQAGTYQVYARFPTVSGAATDAKYTVNSSAGPTVKTVNQTAGAGTWVSLGSYSFAEGNTQKVTLSDQATGTVVADAVKLVRDNATDVDNEKHDYSYRYDANGNLTTITDASPGTRVDSYAVTYTKLNQVDKVTESKSGSEVNSTSFTYNENSAPLTTDHDKQYASYAYDERDLVSKVTNGKSATDASPKVTTYTYTDRGEKLKEVKGNGNTVDYTYFLDGLLKSQTEKKSNGTTLVSESTLDYDLNGNRSHDVTKKMNADNHGAYLTTASDFTYDPRDRLASLTKTGDGAGTETYVHDANNNVTSQTVKGTSTTFNYERNRLLTAATGGATASYNYDPFGRLDTVTAAGTVIERNVYDGFDHVVENRRNNGTATSTTKYTFDPMDRTTTKTTDAGGAKEKTTTFSYLGMSGEVLDEEVAGKLTKSYQYSPWGQRLSQITHKTDGTQEDGYYGYNPHTDVETLTDKTGDTKATYGYTAYGKNDDAQFTGIDKPDTADPTKEPYNAYRFNAKRWDQSSGNYDMGFRDYSPGLNRFLSRDSYNGALADMKLGSNPFTGNRYAFGGGNPISAIENDGHCWDWAQDACDWVAGNAEELTSATQHGLEMALGAAMMAGGSTLVSGGAAICATGVGCFGGGPAAVLGVTLIAGGAGLGVHGAMGLGQDLASMHRVSGSSGGSPSGAGLRTPKPGSTDGGPGAWREVNRGGSEASKAYQETATGVTRGNEYKVDEVDFDGYSGGKLIEAKDNYSSFIDKKTGDWQWWFKNGRSKGSKETGYQGLVREARSHQATAGEHNTAVEWRVSTPEVKAMLERTFAEEGINIPVVVYP
ncbi:RHS repeat-associated core domain-containing protein, partial [Micromonospora sp. NPDC005171]|uniref:golvesin C-terminal-like domain-containing protein n=1 Tax=Micromonospora sp. NPDC005171 TaxID=3156866 RepID=UPI0033AA26E5